MHGKFYLVMKPADCYNLSASTIWKSEWDLPVLYPKQNQQISVLQWHLKNARWCTCILNTYSESEYQAISRSFAVYFTKDKIFLPSLRKYACSILPYFLFFIPLRQLRYECYKGIIHVKMWFLHRIISRKASTCKASFLDHPISYFLTSLKKKIPELCIKHVHLCGESHCRKPGEI